MIPGIRNSRPVAGPARIPGRTGNAPGWFRCFVPQIALDERRELTLEWFGQTGYAIPLSFMSIPPVQALLFDIGNVLLRFDYDQAAKAMAEHSSRSAPEIRAMLDEWQHRHETGQSTSGDFSREIRREIGYKASEEVFREHFGDIFTPNEPMWDYARMLFGKMPVYLFSNISSLHESWIFEKFPEFEEFDGGFYSWRVGSMKPERGMYSRAIEVLQLPPERIGYLDDMPLNVQAGRDAGFRCVQYSPDNHPGFLAEVQPWF